jgi:hypothetical protein
MRNLSWLLLGLVTVGFGSGCGSSSGGPPSCGQVQPCGGSVVGNWKMLGGCLNGAAVQESVDTSACPAATISVSNLQVTGTLSLNADETYSAGSVIETFTMVETLPTSCIGGMTCADLDAALKADTPPANVESVSCSGSSTCTCRFNFRISAMGESGTYTAAGTTLTTTDAAGSASTTEYCVQNNMLHLVELSTTMMTPMGMARIDSDLVAQKQ